MKYKTDNGVAGLTILLSLVVMLFVIGLLVMIFVIMGSKLQDSIYTSTSTTSDNESLEKPTTAGITLLQGNNSRNGVCGTITEVLNGTSGTYYIALDNLTQSGCIVTNATSWVTYGANVRYSYPYTYDEDNTATKVMNDTSSAIGGVTSWFDIFIVIGAMVVLILLTVIIITAIRSSGMISEAGNEGARKVGTA
jgi:uncharacterized membrane protein